MANRKQEQFSNQLLRLFPESSDKIEVGSNHVYDITLQVTEDCNMRCTYCYQHDKTPARMSAETGKKFIDLILEADERTSKFIKSRECPGVVLDFIGGEPFLEIDLIDELTDYFIKRMIELNHPWLTKYRISMISNGLLYFDERVQKYLKKNQGHLSFAITIDGNKELHDSCRIDRDGNGTYDRAMAAVEAYKRDFNREIGTKMTLAPGNISLVCQAIKEYIANGEENINVNCVYEEGWDTPHATELYEQLKDIADYLISNDLEEEHYISILDWEAGSRIEYEHPWCGGNGLMLCVDPRGDIYPCLRYAPSSIGHNAKPLIIGNVDEGILVTEAQESIITCMRCISRQSQDKGTDCESCPINEGCGDCAAYSYEVFGEVGHRTTYHCIMHKARVLAQVYYRNKCYLKNKSKTPLPMNCPKDWAVPIIGEEEYEMLCNLAEEANGDNQCK